VKNKVDNDTSVATIGKSGKNGYLFGADTLYFILHWIIYLVKRGEPERTSEAQYVADNVVSDF